MLMNTLNPISCGNYPAAMRNGRRRLASRIATPALAACLAAAAATGLAGFASALASTQGAQLNSTGYDQLVNDGGAANQSCQSVHSLSMSANANLIGYTCDGTSRPDQYWKLVRLSDGSYELQNYDSGLCPAQLSGSDTVVQQSTGDHFSASAG
jgi:hypothetical protein